MPSKRRTQWVWQRPGWPGFTWDPAALGNALADPNHEEHQSMKRWLGHPFDPRAFDLADINERLAEINP